MKCNVCGSVNIKRVKIIDSDPIRMKLSCNHCGNEQLVSGVSTSKDKGKEESAKGTKQLLVEG